jgi:serralysin
MALITRTHFKDDLLKTNSADVMFGSENDDILRSFGGNDALFGMGGRDTVDGGDGDDILDGDEQDDVLTGGAGNDLLQGADNNDQMSGGSGDDVLVGGRGTDAMLGGEGNDAFVWTVATANTNDSRPGAGIRDRIEDFGDTLGNEDLLEIHGLDANNALAGDQEFVLIGTAAFSAAGQLRWSQSGADVIVQANFNSDLASDFEIQLVNFQGTLDAGDFAGVLRDTLL